jgi:hypothetical protein
MISLQAKVAVESVKAKLQEFDKTYGISEKALNLQKQASEKVKALDEQYKISEKANQVGTQIKTSTTTAANKLKETVQTGVNTVMAKPAVASTVEAVKERATSIGNTVQSTIKDLETETQKAIEEKQKEKKEAQPTPTENKPQEIQAEPVVEDKSNETTKLLDNNTQL